MIGLLLIGYFTIVQRVSVTVGEEATIIKQPWFYGEKGIDLTPKTEQTIWSVSSTQIERTSIQPFPINETFKQLFTSDNIPIDITLHLNFQHITGKTPQLIKDFGKGQKWYTHNLKEPLKNTLTILVKEMLFKDITQNQKYSIELQKAIYLGVKEFLTEQNIPTKVLNVRLGAINMPKEILDIALEEEVAKHTLNLEKIRKEKQEAKAIADKAYMKKMDISTLEYIQLKKLELKAQELNNQHYLISSVKDSNGSIQINMNMQGKH